MILNTNDKSRFKKSYHNDSGYDIIMNRDVVIHNGFNTIDLQLEVEIPTGFMGILLPRSSMMGKMMMNTAPIDAGYEGSINLILFNPLEKFTMNEGERYCQLVVIPIANPIFAEEIKERGRKGVGSSGK